jgi:ribosomal protein S3
MFWKTQKRKEIEYAAKLRLENALLDTNDGSSYALGISKIEVVGKNVNKIIIHLNRPGLLIGSRGSRIDAIEKYLSECYEHPVKIGIVEFDPFQR